MAVLNLGSGLTTAGFSHWNCEASGLLLHEELKNRTPFYQLQKSSGGFGPLEPFQLWPQGVGVWQRRGWETDPHDSLPHCPDNLSPWSHTLTHLSLPHVETITAFHSWAPAHGRKYVHCKAWLGTSVKTSVMLKHGYTVCLCVLYGLKEMGFTFIVFLISSSQLLRNKFEGILLSLRLWCWGQPGMRNSQTVLWSALTPYSNRSSQTTLLPIYCG